MTFVVQAPSLACRTVIVGIVDINTEDWTAAANTFAGYIAVAACISFSNIGFADHLHHLVQHQSRSG